MAHLFFIPGLLPWLDQGGSGGALEPPVGQPLKLWGDGGGPQSASRQSQSDLGFTIEKQQRRFSTSLLCQSASQPARFPGCLCETN